jgi:Tol biopolymer transport system component
MSLPLPTRSAAIFAAIALIEAIAAMAGVAPASGGERGSSRPKRAEIVFTRPTVPDAAWTNLWAIRPDGTGLRRITNYREASDHAPEVSPDGKAIVFMRGLKGRCCNLWLVPAAGGEARQLTRSPGSDDIPAWSPDGRTIAFIRLSTVTRQHHLVLIDANGGNLRRLMRLRPGGLAWLPSGQIAVTHGGFIRVLTRTGRLVRRLPYGYVPSWSPDGRRVAFQRGDRVGYKSKIYVMNADGSGIVRISPRGADDIKPKWSPDGSLIAFEVWRGQRGEVWTMRPDGSHRRSLTRPGGDDRSPAWRRIPPHG